jgi:hypothetical protein
MNAHHEEPIAGHWKPCPPGELAAIGNRARTMRRRRALRIAGGGAVLALVAVIWTSMDMPWSLPLRRNVADIDCPTCKRRLADYERGELPRDQALQVRDHLAGCVWCRWYRDRYYGRDAGGDVQANLGPFAYAVMTPSVVLAGVAANVAPPEANLGADADSATCCPARQSCDNRTCCSGR